MQLTNVVPLFPAAPRNCEQCVYCVELGRELLCQYYAELILDPRHVAENCPTFKADS